jgi:DNA-binding LytR/AlgR family response regulator
MIMMMTNTCNATALIAEDEPVLARGLAKTLGKLWPALTLTAIVHNGDDAVEAALRHLPDVVFLDIQMPERNGLEAAEHIVDAWPASHPLPLIVFVTAFDRFAIDAFERAAVDYVLKPVEPRRLSLTCERLMQRLRERKGNDEQLLAPLRALLSNSALPSSPRGTAPLNMIQAGLGSVLRMVPVADVHYFEADDKYVRVVTQDQALLIRTPLRELLPRLDETQFMQIHRSIVVRAALIDKVVREDSGRIHLHMKGRGERLAVSRSYAHLFKPM